MLYNMYSSYLKDKYKQKVYKIPINLPVSCPNRKDGLGGCTYCSDIAVGYEMLSNDMSVSSRLTKNIDYIVNDNYLDILAQIKEKHSINICIELGLQSVNYNTLRLINRGHSLAEYVDAMIRIKKYDFEVSTHMILNLPYDTLHDVIEGAKIISALKSDFVKMHSLYIAKNTLMEKEYRDGKLNVGTIEDYVQRAGEFIAYLSKDIVIQRLVGRAPKEDTVFCNYDTSWWKIKDMIDEYLISNNLSQGIKCDYLNGKEVKKFL